MISCAVMSDVFEVLDPRFSTAVRFSARLDHLYDGCRWAEGPAYFAAGRYLVWSDIPNDRTLRYDEAADRVGPFQASSGYANGHTTDRQGRLVSCEHGNRRVTRIEHDGSTTVIADRYDGKRLNSPNDVVVHSGGAVYFTDPAYGIDSDYEGFKAESEIGACHVYRVDPRTLEVSIAADGLERPNGLAFSPDESRLYVSDTGVRPTPMHVFDVAADGTLTGASVFATATVGAFDGFRFDVDGRLWTSAGDGVHCYDPDGTLLGKVLVPETVANVCFGGAKRNRLYICATSSLYAMLLTVNGAV